MAVERLRQPTNTFLVFSFPFSVLRSQNEVFKYQHHNNSHHKAIADKSSAEAACILCRDAKEEKPAQQD